MTSDNQLAGGPAVDSESAGEDLPSLILRVLDERGMTQKQLSEESGIPMSTLNAWTTRRRGTKGVNPDKLRALAKALGVPVRIVFEAAGRKVPGRLDEEREAKLLRLYRNLPVDGQRALVQTAEALNRAARAS